jgi:hypothetical protein
MNMPKADISPTPIRFKIVGGADPRTAEVGNSSDPIFAAIKACREAKQMSDAAYTRESSLYRLAEERFGSGDEQHDAREGFVDSVIPNIDEYTRRFARGRWDSIDAFAETVPTTVAGLLAMLAYADEIADGGDRDILNETPIFSTLAIAAKSLSKGG